MNQVKKRKHQNLIQGSLILGVATALVKVIGAIYRIPLNGILGGDGGGAFSLAYDIYLPIYTIAMAGLPVAISRMVAESVSEGRFKDARALLKLARRVFLITGLLCLALLLVAVPIYVNGINRPDALWSMLAITPSILFCCMMSTYRGYYEGLRDMYPTGISQVIEACGKLFAGLGFAYAVKEFLYAEFERSGTVMGKVIELDGTTATLEQVALKAISPYSAAGAILGITIGSVFGAIYLMLRYRIVGDRFTNEELAASPEPRRDKEHFKMLIAIAVPIVLGSLTTQVASLVDLTLVNIQLDAAVKTNAEALRACYGSILDGQTDQSLPNFLYGCYRSYAYSLYNLAPTITSVIGVTAIPVLATAWKAKDNSAIKINIESSIRISSLIALPAGAGLFALSYPILNLIYPLNPVEPAVSTPILRVLGLTTIFAAMTIPATSMLQAIGKQRIPVYNMIIGVILKIGINYFLVSIPSINVIGAPIGTAICYAYIFVANFVALRKYSSVKIDVIGTMIKPLICAAVCGGAAYGTHLLLSSLRGEGSITTVVSVAVAALAYVISMGFTRTLTKNDVNMLPKGQKIAKVLEKIHWID